MLNWKKSEPEWRAYPYKVGRCAGKEGWCVTWHHRSAGVQHDIGGSFPSPEDAMAFAEEHGAKNGYTPCEPRRRATQ